MWNQEPWEYSRFRAGWRLLLILLGGDSHITMRLIIPVLTLSLTVSAVSQSACMPHHDMEKKADTALPPHRMSGIGNGSLEITTSSEEARAWFNQGLNLLHDFWDYESSRAFEQSVKADPNCAMCWWGVYESIGFRGDDDARKKEALQRAKKLVKHASEAEKLWVKAADQSEQQKPSKKKEDDNDPHKDSKETKTLRKLVALRPDDIQAKIFLANSVRDGFKKDHEPKAGSVEADNILLTILKDHPEDSATNHYWIHAMEPGNHPERALESARKLGALAPASGHMVHMPGHIYYRTGDYETARISFEASLKTDERYMEVNHVSVNDDWNYVHNMMYLIADLLEAGRIAEATEVSAKLNHARGDSPSTMYLWSTRDGMTRLNVALPVALRSADWPAAITMLEKAEPPKELVNLIWLRDALLAYARGEQALTDGKTDEAKKQLAALEAMMEVKPAEHTMKSMPMPPAAKTDMVRSSAHSFLEVAQLELKGGVLTAESKPAEADAAFKKAYEANDALGYHEPPNYIRPVGETRGDALLRAGRYADARQAYQDALKDRPNSGYPLYGLAQVAVAQKDAAGTSTAYQRMLSAWQHADAELPQLTAAHAWLAHHRISTGE